MRGKAVGQQACLPGGLACAMLWCLCLPMSGIGLCPVWLPLTLVAYACWGLAHACTQLCVEGPKEKLDSTVYSQPAIYVASLAAVEKLRATEGQVRQGGRQGCQASQPAGSATCHSCVAVG